ncbi:Uncharacterised protein g6093 [Pycnogonum litorale]
MTTAKKKIEEETDSYNSVMDTDSIIFCVAKHCENGRHNSQTRKDLIYHKFPNDEERTRAWLVAVGRQDLCDDLEYFECFQLTHRICSEHFTEKDFVERPTGIHRRPVLKRNAIPCLIMANENKRSKIFKSNKTVSKVAACISPRSKLLPTEQQVNVDSVKLENQPEEMFYISEIDASLHSTNASVDIALANGDDVQDTKLNIVIVPPKQKASPSKLTVKRKKITASKNSKKKGLIIASNSNDYFETKAFNLETPETSKSKKSSSNSTVPLSKFNEAMKKLRASQSLNYRRKNRISILKNRLKAEIAKNSRFSINSMVMNELKECLSATALEFIRNQLEQKAKLHQARRYTEEFKVIAFSIYYFSAKCYQFLSKIFFLPSERSLQRWIKEDPTLVELKEKGIPEQVSNLNSTSTVVKEVAEMNNGLNETNISDQINVVSNENQFMPAVLNDTNNENMNVVTYDNTAGGNQSVTSNYNNNSEHNSIIVVSSYENCTDAAVASTFSQVEGHNASVVPTYVNNSSHGSAVVTTYHNSLVHPSSGVTTYDNSICNTVIVSPYEASAVHTTIPSYQSPTVDSSAINPNFDHSAENKILVNISDVSHGSVVSPDNNVQSNDPTAAAVYILQQML